MSCVRCIMISNSLKAVWFSWTLHSTTVQGQLAGLLHASILRLVKYILYWVDIFWMQHVLNWLTDGRSWLPSWSLSVSCPLVTVVRRSIAFSESSAGMAAMVSGEASWRGKNSRLSVWSSPPSIPDYIFVIKQNNLIMSEIKILTQWNQGHSRAQNRLLPFLLKFSWITIENKAMSHKNNNYPWWFHLCLTLSRLATGYNGRTAHGMRSILDAKLKRF